MRNVVDLMIFFIIKSKAMNTNQKDPGTTTSDGGCCGGIADWGCC
jgi:hypothetical protein